MLDEEAKKRFRTRLKKGRDDIFRLRTNLIKSRQELSEAEIEPEEMALKEEINLSLEQLDENEKDEVEAIDWALRKIETGSYGICESCGREIPEKRLNALPWTRLCKSCAGAHG